MPFQVLGKDKALAASPQVAFVLSLTIVFVQMHVQVLFPAESLSAVAIVTLVLALGLVNPWFGGIRRNRVHVHGPGKQFYLNCPENNRSM